MNLYRLAWLIIISSILSGCDTSYGPPGDYGGVPHGGYTDSKINQNTAIVSFDGNIFTPQHTMNTYVLYRSAQVTIESGYDYFIIVSSSECPWNVHVKTSYSYNDYVSDPPQMHNTFSRREKVESVTETSGPCRGINEHRGAVVVIKMFPGEKPKDLRRAYSATDVITHFGPSINNDAW